MMIKTDFRLVVLLCLCIVPTDGLVCYDCNKIVDTGSCKTTTTCAPDESCFMDRIPSGNTTLFTLGCTPNNRCGSNAGSGSAIIGRSLTVRQDQTCHECCSTDNCAVQLCSHLKPTSCIDDENLDCAHLNTVLNVCADVSHAKHICPRFCGLCNVVDGKWSSWSAWTNCSVTCASGSQTRTRTCNNPAPAYGGEDCHGNNTDVKQCVRELCPVHGGWTSWQQWGACSVTCGVGIQHRRRDCTNPTPSRFGDHCFGDSIDDKLCFPGRGCTDGAWSGWNEWSTCDAANDCNGIRTRSRTCSHPYPSAYGKNCVGNSIQISSCIRSDCLDGKWSSWSAWTNCSVTCASGSQTRTRACNNPAPAYGGEDCHGNNTDVKQCVRELCPVKMDCLEIKSSKNTSMSGLYTIHLPNTLTNIQVYCDMVTDGGGWTVFQKRNDGTMEFFQNFTEYETGFGNITGEFWLGLKTIYELTSLGRSELRIDLTAADGSHAYELFQNFSLSPGRNYTLHIDHGTGTAGDTSGSGLSWHNGYNFVTKDHDNQYGCAKLDHGGWWYYHCAVVNLNGEYAVPGTTSSYYSGQGGVVYYDFKQWQSLKATTMMLRRNK